jgi:microcompartment protein CcmL/EutN
MEQSSGKNKIYPAISLIEFNNTAVGVTAADAMMKKAPIGMLKAGTVSQGKYLVLIGGSTAAVKESFIEGLHRGEESIIDSVFLPDVHAEVYNAILGERLLCKHEALGVIETETVAAIIESVDAGIKGAAVSILELRLADGYAGKGFSLLNGKIEDVEAAVDIALDRISNRSQIIFHRIIPSVHPELRKEIESNLRFGLAEKLNLIDGEVENASW